MSRYTSFDHFMRDLVKVANETCNLNQLFEIKDEEIIKIILKILLRGWWVFLAISMLLSLSASAFGVSIIAFWMNPAGLIITLTFGTAAAATLWKLYRDRQLPLAIKDVGSQYKPLYSKIQDDIDDLKVCHQKIDSLLEDAVITLVSKAKALSQKEKEELEKKLEKKLFSSVYPFLGAFHFGRQTEELEK